MLVQILLKTRINIHDTKSGEFVVSIGRPNVCVKFRVGHGLGLIRYASEDLIILKAALSFSGVDIIRFWIRLVRVRMQPCVDRSVCWKWLYARQ